MARNRTLVTTAAGAVLAPVVARPLDENPAAVYVAGLTSPDSRRTMLAALEVVAGILSSGRQSATELDWSAVRFQHVAAVRSQLAAKYAPATTNKILAALRGTLKTAWKLGQLSGDDYQRSAGVGGISGSTLPRGRMLPPLELLALFTACTDDTTAAGFRDSAILAVMFGAGLRRAELAELVVADVDLDAGTVTVRHGKGRKDRIAHLIGGAAVRLSRWLSVRGSGDGPLFVPVLKSGAVILRRMSAQAIYNSLAKRAAAAGIGDVSPHDGRRTFISSLLDAGADLSVVQQLAGHSNIQTTARYDRRGEKAKSQAVQLVSLPGGGVM